MVIVYFVVYKFGVIVVLFFMLFGVDVFEYWFVNSEVVVFVIDVFGYVKIVLLCV